MDIKKIPNFLHEWESKSLNNFAATVRTMAQNKM